MVQVQEYLSSGFSSHILPCMQATQQLSLSGFTTSNSLPPCLAMPRTLSFIYLHACIVPPHILTYIHNLHNFTLPDEADLDCDGRLRIDIEIPACLLVARELPEGCIELYLFLERSLSLRVMEALGARVVRGEIVSADSAKFSEDTTSSERSFDWTSRVTNDEFMSWFSTECLRVCFFSTFSTGLFSLVSLRGISSSFESTLSLGSLLLMLSVASPLCGVVVEEGILDFSSGFTWVFSWGLLFGLTTGLGTETVSSVQHTDEITDKGAFLLIIIY